MQRFFTMDMTEAQMIKQYKFDTHNPGLVKIGGGRKSNKFMSQDAIDAVKDDFETKRLLTEEFGQLLWRHGERLLPTRTAGRAQTAARLFTSRSKRNTWTLPPRSSATGRT